MDWKTIEQRIVALEHIMGSLQEELKDLENRVDEAEEVQVFPAPHDHLVTSMGRLQSFLIERFPQLAHRLDGAVMIPGITGSGEVGPGNEPMPNHYIGGNLEIDRRRRRAS